MIWFVALALFAWGAIGRTVWVPVLAIAFLIAQVVGGDLLAGGDGRLPLPFVVMIAEVAGVLMLAWGLGRSARWAVRRFGGRSGAALDGPAVPPSP